MQDGASYHYYVAAVSQDGINSNSSSIVSTTTPPYCARLTSVPRLSLHLKWTCTGLDESSASPGFQIQRSDNGGPFDEVGSVAAGVTTFQDFSIFNDQTSVYRVLAELGSESSTPLRDLDGHHQFRQA